MAASKSKIRKLNEYGLPAEWEHTLGLYFDISRRDTGYACMMGNELLHYGHKEFSWFAEDDGEMLHHYQEWVHTLLGAGDFDLLAIEWAPFQKARALELWHGMMTIMKLARFEFGVKMIGVHPAKVKLAAAKQHNASKEDVLRGVNKRYGLKLTNDNIADAIGVGLAIPRMLEGVYQIKWR